VVTANAERAFLAIDSGFPANGAGGALQKHKRSNMRSRDTGSVIFREQDWTGITVWHQKSGTNCWTRWLHDRQMDILYWALSRTTRRRGRRCAGKGLRWMLAIAGAGFLRQPAPIRSGA